MPKCRKCGAEISFKPHPKNPDKLAPFDSDGEIHFATCSNKSKDKPTFITVADWHCKQGHPGRWFYLSEGVNVRLMAWCGTHGCVQTFIPDTPKNRELVNIDEPPKTAWWEGRLQI